MSINYFNVVYNMYSVGYATLFWDNSDGGWFAISGGGFGGSGESGGTDISGMNSSANDPTNYSGQPNQQITYTVYQSDGSGNSIGGDYTTCTVEIVNYAPDALTGLSAALVSPGEIDLSWTASSDSSTTGYSAQWSNDGSTWNNLSGYDEVSTSAVFTYGGDPFGPPGSTWYLQVAAQNSIGVGSYVQTSVDIPYPPPGAPTGVTASSQSSTSIQVNWMPADSYATSWSIQYCTDNASWNDGATDTNAGDASFIFTGLTTGTVYFFRVVATGGSGSSSPSNTAWAAPYSAGGSGVTSATVWA